MHREIEVPTVIPAIRRPEEWGDVGYPSSMPSWVFILGGAVDAVSEATGRLQKRGWWVFVHVDMMRGLSTDAEGLRFLVDFAGPNGVISTHSQTITHAKRVGLWTIQRIFLLDSQSVTTGMQQVLSTRPDAIECLPGVLPEVTRKVVRGLPFPVIAGGLITTREDMDRMRQAGVRGISTSTRVLWPRSAPIYQQRSP